MTVFYLVNSTLPVAFDKEYFYLDYKTEVCTYNFTNTSSYKTLTTNPTFADSLAFYLEPEAEDELFSRVYFMISGISSD